MDRVSTDSRCICPNNIFLVWIVSCNVITCIIVIPFTRKSTTISPEIFAKTKYLFTRICNIKIEVYIFIP